jgi:regulator of RNase E activity RraB
MRFVGLIERWRLRESRVSDLLNDDDRAVIAQLFQAGADLGKPRDVLYYLYFKSRDATEAAASDAAAHAFNVAIQEPLEGGTGAWSLTSERPAVVLDDATVRANTDYFEALAAKFGGEFDGWETSV